MSNYMEMQNIQYNNANCREHVWDEIERAILNFQNSQNYDWSWLQGCQNVVIFLTPETSYVNPS